MRSENAPLLEPVEICSALLHLQAGDMVPPTIYVKDYQDGQVPSWKVAETVQQGAIRVLVLIDSGAPIHATLWEPEGYPGRDVWVQSGQVLASQMYLWRPGCDHEFNKMCDLVQQARHVAQGKASCR